MTIYILGVLVKERTPLCRSIAGPACFLLLLLIFSAPRADTNEDLIEDETCLDCHDNLDQTLAYTPHRLTSQTSGSSVKIGCINCHSGAEEHIDDPSTDNITNPAGQIGSAVAKICGTCHNAHRELDNFGFDAHSVQELNCSECHQVHGTKPSLLLDDRASFCTRCHTSIKSDFSRRSAHPVRQDQMTCLSCHQFTRRKDANVSYDLGRICQDCHPHQGGPHLYEHEAMNGYSVEGAGCIECHDPHGSENDRLLRQPGNEMCKSCHIGHMGINHGTMWDEVWSNYDCQFCHTDTHGSSVSRLYLDPALPAKLGGDCYQSGCHNLGGGSQ